MLIDGPVGTSSKRTSTQSWLASQLLLRAENDRDSEACQNGRSTRSAMAEAREVVPKLVVILP